MISITDTIAISRDDGSYGVTVTSYTKGLDMYILTTWKTRAITPEQTNRMMATWGRQEAALAADASSERVCWFINANGSGGITVVKVKDTDAAIAQGLVQSLSLGEFLELHSEIVLDLDGAMPSIIKGVEEINA